MSKGLLMLMMMLMVMLSWVSGDGDGHLFRVIDLPPACPGVMSKASTRPSQNAPASAPTLEDHRGEGDSLQQALQRHCFAYSPLEFLERCRDEAISNRLCNFASVLAPRWARDDTCCLQAEIQIHSSARCHAHMIDWLHQLDDAAASR